jgi:tRNA dimethylallyltransferase
LKSRCFECCWFLTGPTASGKSVVGVELAKRLGAEIVSMDSMALYRRMDIGTAKPTTDERRAVPHHLIDIIEPCEEYSLAQYIATAEKCAAEIESRQKEVLFVGGTPLYLKGLLRGIFEGPAADIEFRRSLHEEAKRREPFWLHEELKKVDPAAAARLHPNDERRLIRALEVHRATGRPISDWQRQFDVGRSADECNVFVLDWPRADLHARIDRRVEEMFERGLVREVRGLFDLSFPRSGVGMQFPDAPASDESLAGSIPRGGASQALRSQAEPGNEKMLSKTARQAVGYREVIEHLEGKWSLGETIELVKTHTRQLAKRQCTWFRSLSECRFVPMDKELDVTETVDRVEALGRERTI